MGLLEGNIPAYAAPYRRYGADVKTDVEKILPYAAPYAALYCYMLKNGVI
jgi:hypothetical protein